MNAALDMQCQVGGTGACRVQSPLAPEHQLLKAEPCPSAVSPGGLEALSQVGNCALQRLNLPRLVLALLLCQLRLAASVCHLSLDILDQLQQYGHNISKEAAGPVSSSNSQERLLLCAKLEKHTAHCCWAKGHHPPRSPCQGRTSGLAPERLSVKALLPPGGSMRKSGHAPAPP